MAFRRARTQLGKPHQETYQPHVVPASVGGINALDSFINMPEQDCIYCWNITPSELGIRVRKGYTEWAKGLQGPVNSIVPFEGQLADVSNDRLFAVTPFGIYNVSLFGTIDPVPDVPFTVDNTSSAGYGVSTEFVTDAGEGILMYADSRNGLHQYDEATELWTVPVITGPDMSKVSFVTTWKNRLWFIENDSAQAWYLGPDSNSGQATKFTFGSKFKHGGGLRGLWGWTIDGGEGVDDYLMALSRGGDVLVYKGTDPDSVGFSLTGSWYIGEVPESRRGVIQWSGDLYILSTFGIVSLRDLLHGVEAESKESPSAKIARPLRAAIQDAKDSEQWALTLNPSDGFLQVISPFNQGIDAKQYIQNLNTKAWGGWKGVPINSANDWNADYFMGGVDGQVWLYDGTLDGTLLDGTPGQPISFDILTSFQAPEGDHTTHKRVGFIRPVGVVAGSVSIAVKAIYDYRIDQSVAAPPVTSIGSGAEWDLSLWDEANWDFSNQGGSTTIGGSGLGRTFAISTKGSATTRINILAWDVTFTRGGFL